MDTVPEKISFPQTEEEILNFWNSINAFQTSLKRNEGKPLYNFYDGPPFATGLPHYGHILAGTIKDIVTRYAHQTGHSVERRFGWDCHGLPVEFEIDKELGVKLREDVLKMGIPKYNAHCRAIVMRYSEEWEVVVKRIGRWIDFENDYKTLDTSFMESVWWVFKSIYEKDKENPFVYRGFKVMPYSTGCTTPLSNFEANMAYKEVQDPTVIVHFPLVEDPQVSMVAWTTTPWTLPSNLALCVNPDFEYVKVFDKKLQRSYILLEGRLSEIYKSPDLYEIKEKMKGSSLAGKEYVPLFSYFEEQGKKSGAFRILADGYVTADSGTGVVHCAPAFGEDDYRICAAANIIQKGEDIICPINENGQFTSDVSDFAGIYVKDADKLITKKLKESGRVVVQSTINHSYPFCWRSDTPLIYRAVPSWFISVERIREKLLANNIKSRWVPDYVQEKRFHNWLADARDWAVSRNRYWGTPLPIWMSEDGKEWKVIGSIEELQQLSGVQVTDLHRESVDHITIPSSDGKGVLRRVEEVFDCWFESGSMPYAQHHYPFENKDKFEKIFPADFIAEGIDQTRGWFYTLLVISTLLFDQPPFKNVIVNGLVQAADGKKMSKRLKNYPDPIKVVNSYGADALRLYLINSPVVRAEQLKFKEEGVRDILKDVLLPWFNAFRFFAESLSRYNQAHSPPLIPSLSVALTSKNQMDMWVLAAANTLIEFTRQEMANYRLYTVTPKLVAFIEQLTNWFVRLNRKRLKGSEGKEDWQRALSTLSEVLYQVTVAMAPFTPFLTEYFYQNMKKVLPKERQEDSVHYLDFPMGVPEASNDSIQRAVRHMQSVIQLGRMARDRRTLPIKFPLTRVTVSSKDETLLSDIQSLTPYILSELNVKEVAISRDDTQVISTVKCENSLGKRLRKDLKKVADKAKALSAEEIAKLQEVGHIEIEGHLIQANELIITREFQGDSKLHEAAWDEKVLIILDLTVDVEMQREGVAREVVNKIQKMRKKVGILPTDPIEVFFETSDKKLQEVFEAKKQFMTSTVSGIGVPLSPLSTKPSTAVEIYTEVCQVGESNVTFMLSRLDFVILRSALKAQGWEDSFIDDIQIFVLTRSYARLSLHFSTNQNKLAFVLNGKKVELTLGKEIFASSAHLPQ